MERQERLAAALAERGLDALLVSDLTNVRYLTGYVGSNAMALVGPEVRMLLTDGRYATSARAQADGVEVVIGRRDLVADAARSMAELGSAPRVGVEEDSLTLARHGRLEEAAGAVRMVATAGLVEDLRAIKDARELAAIREAAAIADRALLAVLAEPILGRSEADLSFALQAALRREGAEGPSFPIIVAAGANGALPHAVPGEDPIPSDTLVVVDLGAVFRGYCSDMTRTVVVGAPPAALRRAYEVCRAAQEAAIGAVRAGVAAAEVDAAARGPIVEAGFGDAFAHGVGHGVGLDVHERPGVRRESTEALASGMVITVEPGIYLEGLGGVRIEDLVVVTDEGAEVLSTAPKDLTDEERTTA